MTEERYRVPAADGLSEVREKGSRFHARVVGVTSEAAADRALAAFVERHPGATHYCWARRLGEPARERSSDAGEPAGTAGMPMLQVLRGADLSDVLAVVARWFGGIKLGKGPLARAYSRVVRQALAELPVGERLIYETLELEVPYDRLGGIRRWIDPPEIDFQVTAYGDTARCTVRVVPSRRDALIDALAAFGLTVGDRSR